jgi:hypothetical protein
MLRRLRRVSPAAVLLAVCAACVLCAAPAFAVSAPSQQRLAVSAGDTVGDLGYAVAVSGDTAVVGAPSSASAEATGTPGAAYVFTRSGATWTQAQQLTAGDATADAGFGCSVAMSGDTILVGAMFAAVGSHQYQGAVYVFTRSGGTWRQTQKLTTSDGFDGSHFGFSVALDGDTALVGAETQPGEDGVKPLGPAAVYVFTRSGGTWSQQQVLADGAGGVEAWTRYGYSVALDGDTAVVSESRRTVGGTAQQGALHVYTRSAGVWSRQQLLVQSDGASNDMFGGMSIALQGDMIMSGALCAIDGKSRQGAVYVFTRAGSTWTQQQKFTSSDGAAEDDFGSALALDGDRALIAAPHLRSAITGANPGSVYVFTKKAAGWTQDGGRIRAADAKGEDMFGLGVALQGGTGLVGAPGWPGGEPHLGATYILGLPSTISATVAAGRGTVRPAGSRSVAYGATPKYTFTPARGYKVKRVTVDGVAVKVSRNTYTFSPVVAGHVVRVVFAAR